MLIVILSQETSLFCARNLQYLEELRWGIPHADGNLLKPVGEWRQTKVWHRKQGKTKVRWNNVFHAEMQQKDSRDLSGEIFALVITQKQIRVLLTVTVKTEIWIPKVLTAFFYLSTPHSPKKPQYLASKWNRRVQSAFRTECMRWNCRGNYPVRNGIIQLTAYST